MLVEKSPQENDIITIKLISGEEVIAKLFKSDPHSITVQKPLTLMVVPDPSGRMTSAVTPFMLGIDENTRITIDLSKVITFGKVREEMRGQYLKATTGLELPAAPGSNFYG